MKRLLVVDDDPNIIKALGRMLHRERYQLLTTSCPQEAVSLVEDQSVDVVLADHQMPNMLGTELLAEISQIAPACKRLLMSAYQDFDRVMEGFNRGIIHEFIAKPWENSQLISRLRQFLVPARPTESVLTCYHGIRSSSANMLSIFERLESLPSPLEPVCIVGETGTGKELIAKAIHNNSNNDFSAFVAVNCSNFNAEMLESQLFGHRKGAFTGAVSHQKGLLAQADGGTLFLDEVTDISPTVQSKLLRVLQEHEYTEVGATQPQRFDAQIISASSTKMRDAVADKRFRADLMYRLEVIPIELPPLRDRGRDIVDLFVYFFAGHRQFTIDRDLEKALLAYHWPGNVRELQNAASYAKSFVGEGNPGIEHLPDWLRGGKGPARTVEKQLLTPESIEKVLLDCGGNKSEAARRLGISRMSLWRYMNR